MLFAVQRQHLRFSLCEPPCEQWGSTNWQWNWSAGFHCGQPQQDSHCGINLATTRKKMGMVCPDCWWVALTLALCISWLGVYWVQKASRNRFMLTTSGVYGSTEIKSTFKCLFEANKSWKLEPSVRQRVSVTQTGHGGHRWIHGKENGTTWVPTVKQID